MRTRRQALAMSIIALGQGVPFFFGADDLLRSKDMDYNNYNSDRTYLGTEQDLAQAVNDRFARSKMSVGWSR